jgi:hypothetical protein
MSKNQTYANYYKYYYQDNKERLMKKNKIRLRYYANQYYRRNKELVSMRRKRVRVIKKLAELVKNNSISLAEAKQQIALIEAKINELELKRDVNKSLKEHRKNNQ